MTQQATPGGTRWAAAGLVPLAAMWGSSFLFISVAVPAMAVVGISEARAVLGGAAVAALVLAARRPLPFRQSFRPDMMLGASASAGPYLLMSYATEQPARPAAARTAHGSELLMTSERTTAIAGAGTSGFTAAAALAQRCMAGRVALVADAAHAQPSNLGKGAGLAISAASALAHTVSESTDVAHERGGTSAPAARLENELELERA